MNDQTKQTTGQLVTLSPIQKKVLDNALRMLNSLPIQYAIVEPDGNKLGALEVVKPADHRRKPRTYSGYKYRPIYLPVLEKLQENDTADVTLPLNVPEGVTIEHLQSSICGYCSGVWGNGTYTTMLNREKRSVSVLRYAAAKA